MGQLLGMQGGSRSETGKREISPIKCEETFLFIHGVSNSCCKYLHAQSSVRQACEVMYSLA